jgi:hypothetical protein
MAGHRVLKGPREAPFVRKLGQDATCGGKGTFRREKVTCRAVLSILFSPDGGFLLAGMRPVPSKGTIVPRRRNGEPGGPCSPSDANGNVLWSSC